MTMLPYRPLTAAVLAALGVVLSAACGPNAEKRCADLVAAPCPDGQPNHEDGPEYCKSYYDSECSGEWDDYVTCAIQSPRCGDTTSSCFTNEFHVFAKCLCDYESQFGSTPWCGF